MSGFARQVIRIRCDVKTAMSSFAWQMFLFFMDNVDTVMLWFCPACDLYIRNVICDTKTAMSSHAWQVFFIFMDKLDAVMPWFRPVCDLHMCLNYYFLQF